MRFRTQLTNITTFSKLTASLSSLGKVCWMRLEDNLLRFTIIPDQGTQVWAQLPVESIFEESTYTLESNSGTINLEVPISALNRALRSAIASTSSTTAQLRLTKRGSVPLLALTVHASTWAPGTSNLNLNSNPNPNPNDPRQRHPDDNPQGRGGNGPRERETLITQEIPIKVLHESAIAGLHEPRCRDPDVHIILPDLAQLKAISERFTKLASDDSSNNSGPKNKILPSSTTNTNTNNTNTFQNNNISNSNASGTTPKLELSANMHGSLRLAIATDALRISSVWTDLVNPPLDPGQLSQGEMEALPSERMKGFDENDEAGWARVRIDGRDWGRVLSVGRLSPRVVACFIHETALVLYVYLSGSWDGEDSCLTYYINSYAT